MMFAFGNRFRARLSLLIVLLVAPAFALVLYGNLAQRRIQTAAMGNSTRALADLVAANHEAIIKNTRQLLATLTQFSFLVLSTNKGFCEQHFSNLLKLSPTYANFG